MTLLDELKRRNVLRVAAAYIVTAWLAIQVAETILPQFGLEHHVRTVITTLAIGFVPAMILAWALQWTPEGIKLDEGVESADDRATAVHAGRRFDRIVIVILTVALAWFVYDKLVPPAPDVRFSIAVLPFVNESPQEIPDYLAAGLAGEVLDVLAELPELLVIARSSAFTFDANDTEILEVRRQLGVSHVLRGALARVGQSIRVSASLIETDSGRPLWSRTYSGSLDDIFAIQNEIVADVLQAFEIPDRVTSPSARARTPEVYALTLQARQLFYDVDKPESERGTDMAVLLQQALETDPQYVPALVWMSHANWLRMKTGLMSRDEERQRWYSIAARILAVEPENAMVHSTFGYDAMVDGDLEAAASSFSRALNGAPNDAEVWLTAAVLPMILGRFANAIAMVEHSMDIDPLCSYCLYYASKVHMYAGLYDGALKLRQRFVALHEQGHYHLGLIHLLRGEANDAIAVFRDLESREGGDGSAIAGLAMAFHDLEQPDKSDRQLENLVERWAEKNPNLVAQAYAWRDEKDAAFALLAPSELSFHQELELFLNPAYRNLHKDPRWTALRETSGLSDERIAAVQFSIVPELLER